MTSEEIMDSVQDRLDEIIGSLVTKKIESLLSEKNSPELADLVWNSASLRTAIGGYFERHAATTVGNRLRCGIYDGLNMDKIFDSVWTRQFDTAIADRIRKKVNESIDSVISERLKKL